MKYTINMMLIFASIYFLNSLHAARVEITFEGGQEKFVQPISEHFQQQYSIPMDLLTHTKVKKCDLLPMDGVLKVCFLKDSKIKLIANKETLKSLRAFTEVQNNE